MVAVRMVSEGVDIPRLAVGVYATSVSTALFFAQAVGRFVRVRQRGETASVFLPSIPLLLGYAAELEAERDHVLARAADDAEERELAEAQRQRDTPDELGEAPFKAAGGLGALRPGAVRRRRVRHLGRGGRLPRPARAAGARAGQPAAAQAPGRPGPVLAPGRAAAARSRIRAPALRCPRWPRTRRTRPPRPVPPPTPDQARLAHRPRRPGRTWPRCARSSTHWSRPGTTGPASRTPSSTPSCAGPAADRRCRRPPAPSCASG